MLLINLSLLLMTADRYHYGDNHDNHDDDDDDNDDNNN